jgi:heptosyltransferase-2
VPTATGKILVIRGGALGDFILTLPVLAALRANFPDIRLELLGYPRMAELALAAGLVDHAQSIDARPMASFFALGGPLPSELSEYFGSFALIVSYLFDPDRIFQTNVGRCSKAQFLVGAHRPEECGDTHATDVFLRPLERLAIFDPDPVPRLILPGSARAASQPQLGGGSQGPVAWLAVHPGSGSERKNWPESNWAALLRRITAETDLGILLVGGEAEGERIGRLSPEVPTERLHLARNLPLSDLILLLQQCSGYLGHDSGISHLAAAVGLPGVILWGPSRQQVWRPRSERMRLLSNPAGLAAISVEEVFSAAKALLTVTKTT